MAGFSVYRKQFADYKATKATLFWTSAACIAVTLVVGFHWAGWVTGKTAGEMSNAAATTARAELAAAFCAEQFAAAPDARLQLASLQQSDSWKRNDFIEKGGWVNPPGSDTPVSGAASLCVRKLMDPKGVPTKG